MRGLQFCLAAASLLLAATSAVTGAESAGPVQSAAPAAAFAAQCDFESARPWDGWELTPAEPRETGRSEWERAAVEFTVPPAGRVALDLVLDGSGRADFDALELLEVTARGAAPVERQPVRNPGFEEAGSRSALAAGWELSGTAARAEVGSALRGAACLRLENPRRGRSAARQELALEPGRRYQLVAYVRGEVLAGAATLSVLPAGQGALEPLGIKALSGSTLAGGTGLCGRLSAARGTSRVARLDCAAQAGRNYTLEMLVRGELGERGALKVEASALDDAGGETMLAAATLTSGSLGAEWRPLRVSFALRGARRVRVALRLDGPASVELDNLVLGGVRVVPAPRRLAVGDAEENFHPKGARPVYTSGGKRDAELAAAFMAQVGQGLSRPQSSWRFWRSTKPFEHQSTAFAAALEKGLEPGGVYLLDAAGAAEAKWLAERAVSVPDKPGAYGLAVSAKEIVVAARGADGFMAAASALSWLVSDAPEPEIFACRVEDWPANALRIGALEFDGRLTAADRAALGALGSLRLSHLMVTGPGLWRTADGRVRGEARELADAARSATGGGLIAGLDAFGSAGELVRRVPQAAECLWQPAESHYLRGTERVYLAARNVVVAAGASVEVAAADGKLYQEGIDYRLVAAAPRWGAEGDEAPRAVLQRIATGAIPDGAHVTVSYNSLPAGREAPAACPRSEEALGAFRSALDELLRAARPAGVGLGGAYSPRMRTDRRTASATTRFRNGRLLADRVSELCSAAEKAAPGAFPVVWADLFNPCGGLKFPEESPAEAADLVAQELRGRMVMLVNPPAVDEEGREQMARSAQFLAERGYRVAGWTDSRGAAAGRAWAAVGQKLAAATESAAAAGADGKLAQRGGFAGMAVDLRGARQLELEAFAEAAWGGAEGAGAGGTK